MKIVVGLGNPGEEYAETRHNIGWRILDRLASRLGFPAFFREGPVAASQGRCQEGSVILVKPMLYMNRSGLALAEWLDDQGDLADQVALQVAEEADLEIRWPGMLVIADDVNLPLGKIRLRPEGSCGGHNGLADIERIFNKGYPRLRVGVGEKAEADDLASHVLGGFSGEDAEMAGLSEQMAVDAVLCWIKDGVEEARQRYNGLSAGKKGTEPDNARI